jgi:hypothetical protein
VSRELQIIGDDDRDRGGNTGQSLVIPNTAVCSRALGLGNFFVASLPGFVFAEVFEKHSWLWYDKKKGASGSLREDWSDILCRDKKSYH